MEVALLLLLLSITSNYAQFTVPAVCYDQSVINGTACCQNLRSQCDFTAEESPIFNCTHATNLLYLSMSKCGLAGTIPSDITQLPYLIRFDLSFNDLEGTIPEEIGEIGNKGTGLQYMDLSHNELDGTIPKTLGDEPLPQTLKHLDMSHNNFIRASWPAITELLNLEYLDLSSNNIAETFHESVGQFSALRVLNLGDNRFAGTIPFQMGVLTELTILSIERNSMSGQLPSDLSQINDLKILNISDNKFSGTVPSEWGSDWGVGGLESLNMGDNEFNCPVRDYSEWGKETDFLDSYGEDGNINCNSGSGGSSDNKGLDGVEVAIIVIAVVVVLAIGVYCWHGKTQQAKQVAMLQEDVFDD